MIVCGTCVLGYFMFANKPPTNRFDTYQLLRDSPDLRSLGALGFP